MGCLRWQKVASISRAKIFLVIYRLLKCAQLLLVASPRGVYFMGKTLMSRMLKSNAKSFYWITMFLLRPPKLNFPHSCLSVVRANSRAIFIAIHFSQGKCKQQPRFLTSNFKSTALRSYSSNAARFQDDRKVIMLAYELYTGMGEGCLGRGD